jgi:hypothetical protein
MHSVSVAAAAQVLLARVATNVGEAFGAMLDMLAQELAESVRIYGLDGGTGAYRAITVEELRAGYFNNGAAVLKTAGGGVFTLMTVHRNDFAAYVERLDQMDAGTWNSDSDSAFHQARQP